jgi:hypothetical protein
VEVRGERRRDEAAAIFERYLGKKLSPNLKFKVLKLIS